jgi:DNA-binding Lrp family transcriptional regulator
MADAFVLINAEIGEEENVLRDLESIQEVKEAHMVYGVYDIIALVRTDSMEELKNAVSWGIRRMNRIKSTLTMLVIE